MMSDEPPPHRDNPPRTIRVLAWSPYKRLETALRELIEGLTDAEPVELAPGVSFPADLRDYGTDVLVLDVDGSATGSANLIGRVLLAGHGVNVVVLSAHRDRRFVESALQSGATGYVLKDRAFEELPDAVRAAARNQRYVSPSVDGRNGHHEP
jgi:DNA-binding NarL/FixJ family response regulator